MKIEINVLPDKQKEKIREEKKIGFALKLVFSFVGALLLLNAVLYLLQGVLGIEYQAAQKIQRRFACRKYGKGRTIGKSFSGSQC